MTPVALLVSLPLNVLWLWGLGLGLGGRTAVRETTAAPLAKMFTG